MLVLALVLLPLLAAFFLSRCCFCYICFLAFACFTHDFVTSLST